MSLALSVWDIPENPIHANMFYYEQTGGVPPMDATIGI
jgi:hypothetical protein